VTSGQQQQPYLQGSHWYDPWWASIEASGTRYNPFRFTGSYLDAGTPFYRMGARYYAPGQGRFTQQDPLGSSVLEANRYHYASCNPTNYTDPTGLFPTPTEIARACVEWAFVGYVSGLIIGALGGALAALFGMGPLGIPTAHAIIYGALTVGVSQGVAYCVIGVIINAFKEEFSTL
jgi:RHS repeat-associated protein